MVIRGNRDKDDGITTEMGSVVCGNTVVIIINWNYTGHDVWLWWWGVLQHSAVPGLSSWNIGHSIRKRVAIVQTARYKR